MKVALIGASGNVGQRLLAELLNRGHEVTGIVRHPEKLPPREGLTAKRGDINLEMPRHSSQRFTVGYW